MNYIKYYTRGALMGIVLAFTSGGILQTFLHTWGLVKVKSVCILRS